MGYHFIHFNHMLYPINSQILCFFPMLIHWHIFCFTSALWALTTKAPAPTTASELVSSTVTNPPSTPTQSTAPAAASSTSLPTTVPDMITNSLPHTGYDSTSVTGSELSIASSPASSSSAATSGGGVNLRCRAWNLVVVRVVLLSITAVAMATRYRRMTI